VLVALKPEYAEVLTRIDLHGESRSHVAASLKTSENNLTVRLFRARRAFKAAWADSRGKSCADVGPRCGCHSQRHQTDRGAITHRAEHSLRSETPRERRGDCVRTLWRGASLTRDASNVGFDHES
jgi:hypothetical protein